MTALRAPWDYSRQPTSLETATINAPTPEGAELGRHLARFADQEEAAHPDAPKRCGDCAFRAGTLPNQCPQTLMDAVKCTMEGEPFHCHLGMRDGEPTRLCAGYLLMKCERDAAKGGKADG